MYIAMDCETGGIEPAYSSLLTATLQMLDEDFEHIMTLELKIKHSIYLVSAEALAVNKIDLVKHHAEAMEPDEARTLLKSFLTGYEKPIPVGHNVEFDLAHIDNFHSGFRNSLSHRKLDTATIARFLQLCGKIDPTVSGLEGYCRLFHIPLPDHTASGDIASTIALLKSMIRISR